MQQNISSLLSRTSFLAPFLTPFLTDHVPSMVFSGGLHATSKDFICCFFLLTIFLIFCSPFAEA